MREGEAPAEPRFSSTLRLPFVAREPRPPSRYVFHHVPIMPDDAKSHPDSEALRPPLSYLEIQHVFTPPLFGPAITIF